MAYQLEFNDTKNCAVQSVQISTELDKSPSHSKKHSSIESYRDYNYQIQYLGYD